MYIKIFTAKLYPSFGARHMVFHSRTEPPGPIRSPRHCPRLIVGWLQGATALDPKATEFLDEIWWQATVRCNKASAKRTKRGFVYFTPTHSPLCLSLQWNVTCNSRHSKAFNRLLFFGVVFGVHCGSPLRRTFPRRNPRSTANSENYSTEFLWNVNLQI